jgi:hypothetical protein
MAMRVSRRHPDRLQAPIGSSRRATAAVCATAALCLLAVWGAVSPAPAAPLAPGARAGAVHAICSGPNSAHVPCHFSTPSGNIRCVWTPVPNNVACVLRATGRAYRLRPTGHARAITLRLARRGQTLPRNQQLVFPQSLSCRDTKRTMVCNQDFGTGAFTLARGASHRS